jgi:hypothetical protein
MFGAFPKATLPLLLFVSADPAGAQAPSDWSRVRCSNGSEVLELARTGRSLDASTQTTRAFLSRIPCDLQPGDQPLFRCQQSFGGDSFSFSSELRHEQGYPEETYAFVDRERWIFRFERSYRDAQGNYQQARRTFSFLREECEIQ